MISLTPAIPADLPATLDTLSAMLALLSDPAAAKDRIDAMQKATQDLREAISASEAERATFAVAQADHQQALDKATAAQADQLSKERTAFDAECANRKSELDTRADQLSQLQAQAKADAEAAASLKADLQRRVDAIKSATA